MINWMARALYHHWLLWQWNSITGFASELYSDELVTKCFRTSVQLAPRRSWCYSIWLRTRWLDWLEPSTGICEFPMWNHTLTPTSVNHYQFNNYLAVNMYNNMCVLNQQNVADIKKLKAAGICTVKVRLCLSILRHYIKWAVSTYSNEY